MAVAGVVDEREKATRRKNLGSRFRFKAKGSKAPDLVIWHLAFGFRLVLLEGPKYLGCTALLAHVQATF